MENTIKVDGKENRFKHNRLDLSGRTSFPLIRDIDFKDLKNLQKIEEIDLSNNRINNVLSLSHVKNLKILKLSNNKIRDLSELGVLNKLETLFLDGNELEIITGLDLMPNLSKLYLQNNKIQDVQGIEHLENLELIDLRFNQITDFKTLKLPPNLKQIFLTNNPIPDNQWNSIKNSPGKSTSEKILQFSFLNRVHNPFKLTEEQKQKTIENISLFFSYALADSEKYNVKNLAKELMSKKGISQVYCWELWDGFPDGNIVRLMEEGIDQSEYFVTVCSQSSLLSKNCQKERDLAHYSNKKIIPMFEDFQYVPGLCQTQKGIEISGKKTNEIVDEIINLIKVTMD